MKKLYFISLTLLFFVFACETESLSNSDLNTTTYRYDSEYQFSTIESFIIDFENFSTGDIVSEILITDPFENVQVEGITMAFPDSNAAMIFDSSNPTGGDFDIGTPNEIYGGPGIGNGGASNNVALGNVLILSEDLDQNDPDDILEIGASFVFNFSANDNVTLNSFDILDIEAASNPTIVNLYDNEANIIFSTDITPGGDNSKTTVDLNSTFGVAFMEIIMNNSGAIDNISLGLETEEPCVECDSNIVELTFRYIGASQESAVRIETLNGDILFNDTVEIDELFTISGNASDGTFSSDLIVFIDNEQVAQLATDCSQIIGPGLLVGSLEIVSGSTQTGGHLCPVEVAF